MDGARFDTLTRSLTPSGSRRRALVATLGGALGLLGWHGMDDTSAHDLKKKCKKKSGDAKKKCLKKAKKHNAQHASETSAAPPPPPPLFPVLTYQCPGPRIGSNSTSTPSTTRFA